jgi:predicted alpha/beta hydrolase family esterase
VSTRRFLVLHGWQNHRPAEHWQWWLVDRLRSEGEQVLYPQLPSPDAPRLAEWQAALAAEWAQMGDGERVVVAHSLSCLLWMRSAAAQLLGQPADRVLLVAPPSPEAAAGFPEMREFAAAPGDELLVALAESSRTRVRLVASDEDEYCTEGPASLVYGRPLALDAETLPGAGPLTVVDGYGPWPAALAWCQEPSTRFTPR